MAKIEDGNVVHGLPFGKRKQAEVATIIEVPGKRQIWEARINALNRLNSAIEKLREKGKTD